MALSRDQVFGADRRRVEAVEVPEWGEGVYVRRLNIAGRLEVEHLAGQAGDMAVRLVVLCACDEDGARLFDDADHRRLAEEADGKAVERVAMAAFRFNKLGREDVEDAAKN